VLGGLKNNTGHSKTMNNAHANMTRNMPSSSTIAANCRLPLASASGESMCHAVTADPSMIHQNLAWVRPPLGVAGKREQRFPPI
jgi:hypothetical protein